ncbi:centrosomal protein of 89 kDa-like [Daktulosphaira vitifoliae]|uniref:centrosomal protein of 89 kDa-like n=1 Tax=Daktulosphaira vitifoliae TaxID=58002 RepID=UPI0021AA1EBC|nr:centrosomal protein of 89 kDa-like [Daktulosphaira vitifoliae]
MASNYNFEEQVPIPPRRSRTNTSDKVPYIVDVVAERSMVPLMERMSRHEISRLEMSPLDRLRNNVDMSENVAKMASHLKQLEKKRDELKRQCTAIESMNRQSEVNRLTEKNNALKQDVFVLKNLTYKLNQELEKCQDKLLSRDQISESSSYMRIQGPKGINWRREDLSAVSPLLEAYQTSLEEKDITIETYKNELARFSTRSKEIVAENENLYQQLEEANDKIEVTYVEWKSLELEVASLKEHNELLIRQAKLHQAKLQDLLRSYQSRVTELNSERDHLTDKYENARMELLQLQSRVSNLAEDLNRMKTEDNNKIPISVHTSAVNECRRLFEELKVRYDDERDTLMRRLIIFEEERPALDIKIVSLTTELNQQRSINKALDLHCSQLKSKCEILEKQLLECESEKNTNKKQLGDAMVFLRETINDQEALLQHAAGDSRNSVSAAMLSASISARVKALTEHLKSVEQGAHQEVNRLSGRLYEQSAEMERMKKIYENEINALKNALLQKQSVIDSMDSDRER